MKKNWIWLLVVLIVLAAAVFFLLSHPESEKSASVNDQSIAKVKDTSTSGDRPAVKEAAPEKKSPEISADDREKKPAGPQVVLRVEWGEEESKLGRSRPQEGNPEGPMAFWVGEGGEIYVLDQVNSRVQVFRDGKAVRSFPLPASTFQDFAFDSRGRMVALDRFVRDEAALFDENGRPTGSVKLTGEHIAEGGLVTAVYYRPDGVWAEVNNEKLVRIADADGKAVSPREVVPGRFSRDGRLLLAAALDGKQAAAVFVRPLSQTQEAKLLARVEFPIPVLQLTALESDLSGRILLAAYLARFRETEPYDALEQYEQVVVLAPDGQETARINFAPRPLAEEVFHPVFITPAGVIYQMVFEERGVTFWRYAP
jgi:hypothetical protein